MIKEAECYLEREEGRVECSLCPRRCVIGPSDLGFCRVRQNRDGRLYTLIYGETSGQAIEPIEKTLFHFYPGTQTLSVSTIGCSFSCPWCENYNISQAKVGGVVTFEIRPEEVVGMAKKYGVESVTYTYNEPVIWYEFVKDTARLNREESVKNVLVTNGYITLDALGGLIDYIDGACVDVKSFSREFYRTYCSGELDPVLDSIKYMVGKGVEVELTYLVIPLLNDSLEEIGEFVGWVMDELNPSIPVHFDRFHPIYKMADRPPTPADTLIAAANLAYERGLEYVYVKNVFVEGLEDTHCPRCHTPLISRYSSSVTSVHLTERNECPSCGLKIPIVGRPRVPLPGQY